MAVVELSDKAQIRALLTPDPLSNLEALEESLLGVDGLVTLFYEPEAPVNKLVVRWGQRALGMGSLGMLSARRLSGLAELMERFPVDRGHIELLFPFWAAGALSSTLRSEPIGAGAIYTVDQATLRPSQVVRQCARLEELEIIKPMFPKLAKDTPAYVLALRDQLVAVAAVTHLQEEIARVRIYTVEHARRRGFGRGVLTALCEELLALKVVPSVYVDLGHEASVRMVEGAGFAQTAAFLKANILGKLQGGEGLVQLSGVGR